MEIALANFISHFNQKKKKMLNVVAVKMTDISNNECQSKLQTKLFSVTCFGKLVQPASIHKDSIQCLEYTDIGKCN